MQKYLNHFPIFAVLIYIQNIQLSIIPVRKRY